MRPSSSYSNSSPTLGPFMTERKTNYFEKPTTTATAATRTTTNSPPLNYQHMNRAYSSFVNENFPSPSTFAAKVCGSHGGDVFEVATEAVASDPQEPEFPSFDFIETSCGNAEATATTTCDAACDNDSDTIGPHDVLLGRGGRTNSHIGNKRYRRLVAEHQSEYLVARKKDKILIARQIVSLVKEHGGRFLKQGSDSVTRASASSNDNDAVWIEVTDKRATEKTSQALREGLDVRNKTIRPHKMVRRDDSDDDSTAGGDSIVHHHHQQHHPVSFTNNPHNTVLSSFDVSLIPHRRRNIAPCVVSGHVIPLVKKDKTTCKQVTTAATRSAGLLSHTEQLQQQHRERQQLLHKLYHPDKVNRTPVLSSTCPPNINMTPTTSRSTLTTSAFDLYDIPDLHEEQHHRHNNTFNRNTTATTPSDPAFLPNYQPPPIRPSDVKNFYEV